MRKLCFTILCWFENIKAAIHCKRCGFPCNDLNTCIELVDLREALHLLSAGFEPMEANYTNSGERNTFHFHRTPALLMALDTYRKAIREAVSAVGYDDLVRVCDIPGSKISPDDGAALDNTVAPRGHVREAFAYESWPVAMRQAYIAGDADTRRRMVDAAYQRG